MHRRSLLGSSLAALATLAGCAGRGDDETQTATAVTESETATKTETATPTATPQAVSGPVTTVAGVDLPVPDDQLGRGAPRDAIPAITEPAFADDWAGVELEAREQVSNEVVTKEPRLRSDDRVIGVERDGTARAYPLRVLNWHEVVNDELGGPLLVTFCPLCDSGVTAVGTVADEPTTFGVSGLLWNSDLVMYDRATGSLWSQIAATAIRGRRTGHRLELVPSEITTLGDWRSAHPDTQVLLPPPASETVGQRDGVRDYTRNPYASYDDVGQIGIGRNSLDDDRLNPKTRVLGVRRGGEAVAYPLPTVTDTGGVVEDTVGDTPVVVATGSEGSTLHGWVRTVGGETLSFEAAGEGRLAAGGSTWLAATGEAVDGPYEGRSLTPASDAGQLFWFAWVDFTEETRVYGRNEE
jgi:hypothetical protein